MPALHDVILKYLFERHEEELSGLCSPSLFGSTFYLACTSLLFIVISCMEFVRPSYKDLLFSRLRTSSVFPRLPEEVKELILPFNLTTYVILLMGCTLSSTSLMLAFLIILASYAAALECQLGVNVLNKQFRWQSLTCLAFLAYNWFHSLCFLRFLVLNS